MREHDVMRRNVMQYAGPLFLRFFGLDIARICVSIERDKQIAIDRATLAAKIDSTSFTCRVCITLRAATPTRGIP